MVIHACIFTDPNLIRQVAVITISGQRLRLVQGYADPETCKFRLYIAKIAIDNGKRDRWELHSLILAWLLSKPVGTTT